MTRAYITGTGLFTPPHRISNEELVAAYNAWADRWNEANAAAIAAGDATPKPHSSSEFIEKASGVKARRVLDKDGILDPARMRPRLPARSNTELCVLAEIAVDAGRQAMKAADVRPADVDAVICAASNMQRPYPAIAIEVQEALGIDGYAYDMNVACSSATFGLQNAVDAVANGSARRVLMVNPEICSGHLNFCDRDSHFIFGDVATAVLVEADDQRAAPGWEVLGAKLKTRFSNNIRNNFGFLNRAEDPETRDAADKLFVQEGRKVFKEVTPLVAGMIQNELDRLELSASDLRRMWLHQANANMNRLIAEKVLGREATPDESPTVLDEYANTSSAGSIIAFHSHSADLVDGDLGIICSFGAGYSAGVVTVRKAA